MLHVPCCTVRAGSTGSVWLCSRTQSQHTSSHAHDFVSVLCVSSSHLYGSGTFTPCSCSTISSSLFTSGYFSGSILRDPAEAPVQNEHFKRLSAQDSHAVQSATFILGYAGPLTKATLVRHAHGTRGTGAQIRPVN